MNQTGTAKNPHFEIEVGVVGNCLLRSTLLKYFLEKELGFIAVNLLTDIERNKPATNSPGDRLYLLDAIDMSDGEVIASVDNLISILGAPKKTILIDKGQRTGKEDEFLDLGIKGIVADKNVPETIDKAINSVLNGELWYPRKVLSSLLIKAEQRRPAKWKNDLNLTARESEILSELLNGSRNNKIAERLNISQYTVKAHLHNIFKKIGVKSRSEAILWAKEHPPRKN